MKALSATWITGNAALEVCLSKGLTLALNDFAGKSYRKVTSLRVPRVCLKALVSTSTSRQNWLEAARYVSDANLDIYSAPQDWQESARFQAKFIQAQDALTGRAKVLFDNFRLDRNSGMFNHEHFLFMTLIQSYTVSRPFT